MAVNQENNNTKKSLSERRKQSYRELLNRVEGLQEIDDVGINTVKELGEILKEVNIIDEQCPFQERVEYSDETLLESVVLSSASGVLVKCLENLDIFASTYESSEFASKILNFIKNPEDEECKPKDWYSILEEARAIVPAVPRYTFLYGSFDPTKLPESKQRKERRKRDARENVVKKSLEKVHHLEQDEQGVNDTVNFLGNIINTECEKNKSKSIGYFDFVIDNKDFTSTIENMFYTSFLIRDGKAKLDIGSDGRHMLYSMTEEDLKHFRNKGGVNAQAVASFTMKDWEMWHNTEGYIQQYRKRKTKT